MTVEDRLRAAHARIPDPDEATIARARALLLAESAAAPAEVGARDDAAPHVGFPSRVGRAASRPAKPRRLAVTRLALPLAALALSAVAALAILPREAERPVAAGGDVIYERSVNYMNTLYVGRDGKPTADPTLAMFRVTSHSTSELWLAPDGSGRLAHGKASTPRPATPADAEAWRKAGSPDLSKLAMPPRAAIEFKPSELFAALIRGGGLNRVLPKRDPLSAVPTDPLALRDLLMRAARAQNPRGTERGHRNRMAQSVLALLSHPQSTRAQRAALIGIVRALAGTRELGEITDPAGRKGRAFRLPPDMAGGPVLAYDPATDRLLARGTLSRDGIVWGAAYTIIRSRVEAVGARP
jgi:hypothetical protein